MDKYADEIDRLESEILSLIDEIQLVEYIDGFAVKKLKDKLNRKREDLHKVKHLMERILDADRKQVLEL